MKNSFNKIINKKDQEELGQDIIYTKILLAWDRVPVLRWYGTLEYGDFHEKFNFLKYKI